MAAKILLYCISVVQFMPFQSKRPLHGVCAGTDFCETWFCLFFFSFLGCSLRSHTCLHIVTHHFHKSCFVHYVHFSHNYLSSVHSGVDYYSVCRSVQPFITNGAQHQHPPLPLSLHPTVHNSLYGLELFIQECGHHVAVALSHFFHNNTAFHSSLTFQACNREYQRQENRMKQFQRIATSVWWSFHLVQLGLIYFYYVWCALQM